MLWSVVAACTFIAMMVGVATFSLDITGLVVAGVALLLCEVILWMVVSERAEMQWTLFAASFAMLPVTDLRLPMGGLFVPVAAFFAVLAMGITSARWLVTRDWRLEDHGILFSLALILLGWTLSLTVAKLPDLSVPLLLKWIFHSVLFVMLMSFRNRVWHYRTVLTLILVTGALSVYGLFEHVVSEAYDLNFYAGVGTRSATGQHLALVLPLALGVAMIRRLSWPVRLSVWMAAGVSLAALIFTYSRNGWVSVMIAILVVALSGRRTGRQGAVALSLALCVFLYLGYLAPEGIQSRFWSTFLVQESRDSAITNAQRLRQQARAVKVILDHPITGVGLGNYVSSIDWYQFQLNRRTSPAGAVPHNFYLTSWAEGGVFVFAGLIGLLYFVAKRVLRGIRECAGTIGADLLRGALGSLVSLFMLLIFTDDFNSILVWTLLGLAVSGAHAWAGHGSEDVADASVRHLKRLSSARRRFGVRAPSSVERMGSTS